MKRSDQETVSLGRLRGIGPLCMGLLLVGVASCAPVRKPVPPPAPDTPTGVTATPGEKRVTVRWNPVPGASTYNLYWDIRPGVTPASGKVVKDVSSPYIHTGLINGRTYYYVVTAIRAGVELPPSVIAEAIPGDRVPPDNVTSLAARPGDGRIRLSWDNPKDRDFAGVVVRRSTTGFPASTADGTAVADTEGTDVTDTGLTNGTTYYYTAFAYDYAGNHAAGVRLKAMPADTVAPARVADFTAAPFDGTVVLNWKNPTDPDLAGVVVRRSTSGFPSTPTDGQPVFERMGSEFTDTGLANDTTYFYTAFSYDLSGNYSPGVQVSVRPEDRTPPGEVTAFRARKSDDGVTLQWRPPSDADLAGIMIRKGSAGRFPSSQTDGELVADVGPTQHTFVDRQAVADGGNLYAAFAYDRNGNYSPGVTTRESRAALYSFESAVLQPSGASRGDQFGLRVAISGNNAIIGASQGETGGADPGTAYVFAFSQAGWKQQARLRAGDASTGSRFAFSVSLSDDLALIGAPFDPAGGRRAGAAYVFERMGDPWLQRAKLLPADVAPGDQFGYAVAVSGDTAVVGAPFKSDGTMPSGAAYVFRRVGGVWAQRARLLPSDMTHGAWFGFSVAISGDTLLVGAPMDGTDGNRTGAVYVFQRAGDGWAEQSKLLATQGAVDDSFGFSVALDGDLAVVGAVFDDTKGMDAGAAYVFQRSENAWTAQSRLVADDGEQGGLFGSSVAVTGDTILVGAYQERSGDSQGGAAYVFQRTGDAWTQQSKLTASDAQDGDAFGSVAISSAHAIVGASRKRSAGTETGAAYIFD